MKTPVFFDASRCAAPRHVKLPSPGCRNRLLLALLALVAAPAALANGVGENISWQFQTRADKVNQAVVQDMIQKRKSGFYSPPNYTTNIDRQFNCSQTPNAIGNDSNQGASALSPSNSGSKSDSTGNANANTSGASGAGGAGGTASNSQGNSGSVGSSINGSTNTDVNGSSSQALNNNQNNSGNQSASLTGSTACTFGVLN